MSRWYLLPFYYGSLLRTVSVALSDADYDIDYRLLNYTPQGIIPTVSSRSQSLLTGLATLVRLLTINSVNAYITSWVLYLSGGSEDPRLLLPAWICIVSVKMHPQPLQVVFNCSDQDLDFDLFVSFDPSTTCDSEGDISINIRVFYCQLYKHGQFTTPTTLVR